MPAHSHVQFRDWEHSYQEFLQDETRAHYPQLQLNQKLHLDLHTPVMAV